MEGARMAPASAMMDGMERTVSWVRKALGSLSVGRLDRMILFQLDVLKHAIDTANARRPLAFGAVRAKPVSEAMIARSRWNVSARIMWITMEVRTCRWTGVRVESSLSPFRWPHRLRRFRMLQQHQLPERSVLSYCTRSLSSSDQEAVTAATRIVLSEDGVLAGSGFSPTVSGRHIVQ